MNGQPIDKQLPAVLNRHNLDIPLHDEVSHFIARLCFCQTTEKRRWFLNTEKALFEARYKLMQQSPADKIRIHKQLCGNSNYEIFTKHMIMSNEQLNGMNPIPKFQEKLTLDGEAAMLPFYKVPFQEVMSLIGRRSVFLLNGFAYVPSNRFFNLITGKFRAHLNRGLVAAQKAIQKMKCDPIRMECVSKVMHIIDGLHQITNGPAYRLSKDKKQKITHKEVNKLSAQHYPLCMQNTIEHLKSDGHMKHGARMHLGLFLKGIGLSLSEALIYYRKAFTKIGGDKFNKQYAYNVRHNYGKEGKRIDYTPYSCNKIIGCAPNNGDFHGCPFKLFDTQRLSQYLAMSKNMNSNDAQTVVQLAKQHHYQLACKHVFSTQHKQIMKRKNVKIDEIDSQWSHPNEYFDHSWRLYHGEKEQEDTPTADENTNNRNTNNAQTTNNENKFAQRATQDEMEVDDKY
eukprot:302632_1